MAKNQTNVFLVASKLHVCFLKIGLKFMIFSKLPCSSATPLPRFLQLCMAPNLPHSIFDPLSCTGTQWIVDEVMIEHSLYSVLICDIHTARFPLDCSRAAVCPCMLFRVRRHPHSEGCEGVRHYLWIFRVYMSSLIVW